jgi:hypothetical protein
MKAPGGTAKKN